MSNSHCDFSGCTKPAVDVGIAWMHFCPKHADLAALLLNKQRLAKHRHASKQERVLRLETYYDL